MFLKEDKIYRNLSIFVTVDNYYIAIILIILI